MSRNRSRHKKKTNASIDKKKYQNGVRVPNFCKVCKIKLLDNSSMGIIRPPGRVKKTYKRMGYRPFYNSGKDPAIES
jgi:hypothetical protein